MDKLSIVIADDHAEWCITLKNQLEQYPFFEVTGIFHDGEQALAFIQRHQPDILLLDIIMPGADGLYIASYAREKMGDYDPFICIISAIGTAKTNKLMKTLEVDYYFIKPISTLIVAENIYRLLSTNGTIRYLLEEAYLSESADAASSTHQIFDCPITEGAILAEIEDFIYELGIPLHLIGSKAIIECIYCHLTAGNDNIKITDIYKMAANRIRPKSTGSRVERVIRHALSITYKSPTRAFLEVYRDGITNKVFLCNCALAVKRRIESKFGDQVYRRAITELRRMR